MLKTKPKHQRIGQTLFNFLEWINQKGYAQATQSARMADVFYIDDALMRKHYEEFLTEMGVEVEQDNWGVSPVLNFIGLRKRIAQLELEQKFLLRKDRANRENIYSLEIAFKDSRDREWALKDELQKAKKRIAEVVGIYFRASRAFERINHVDTE